MCKERRSLHVTTTRAFAVQHTHRSSNSNGSTTQFWPQNDATSHKLDVPPRSDKDSCQNEDLTNLHELMIMQTVTT